jgi:hypothetical protein
VGTTRGGAEAQRAEELARARSASTRRASTRATGCSGRSLEKGVRSSETSRACAVTTCSMACIGLDPSARASLGAAGSGAEGAARAAEDAPAFAMPRAETGSVGAVMTSLRVPADEHATVSAKIPTAGDQSRKMERNMTD